MSSQSSPSFADDNRLDDAVVAYLESVEAGQPPDRAQYPELAEFFADADAVRRWATPLRQAAQAVGCVAGDPEQTVDLPGRGTSPPHPKSVGDYEVIEELGRGG